MESFLLPPEITSEEQHENKNPQDVFKIVMTLTLIEPSLDSPLTFEPQRKEQFIYQENCRLEAECHNHDKSPDEQISPPQAIHLNSYITALIN